MNHYETLRETVYKILYPDGIPLEFGCEVLAMHNDTGNQFYDRINSSRRLSFEEAKHQTLPDWYAGSYFIEHGYLQAEDKKILGRRDVGGIFRLVAVLGKPLSIADVLRAVKEEIGSQGGTALRTDVQGTTLAFYGTKFDFPEWQVPIKLALPLSAPENSEACEVLNNLLK